MIAAVIIGALTAWYLGLRAGVIAAIATGAGLLIATFVPVPGVTLTVYALVLAWAAALYFLGPKIGVKAGQGMKGVKGAASGAGLASKAASAVGQATDWAKKMFSGSDSAK